MGRLIDADKLIKKFQSDKEYFDKVGDTTFAMAAIGVIHDIEDAPTIDAVEVVRCKDCKYWHDHITTTWCSRGAELRPQESGWIKRNADDFCSYGERTDHE